MASFFIQSPIWFMGYDVAIELAFAAVSFMVAFLALRLYRITDQRQSKLFGISFILISFSYVIQALFSFLAMIQIGLMNVGLSSLWELALISIVGGYGHMILMLSGLATLLYMTFGDRSLRSLILMISVSSAALLFSSSPIPTFYALTSLFFVFIACHYVENYMSKKKAPSLMVALAFVFLLFGNIHYFFSVDHQFFYVLGQLLEFAAYVLIFINMRMVLKK